MAMARKASGHIVEMVLLALAVTLFITAKLAQAQDCGDHGSPCPRALQCRKGRCWSCSIPWGSRRCGPGGICPIFQVCKNGRFNSCRTPIPSDLYMPSEYVTDQVTDPTTYSVKDQGTDLVADAVTDAVTELDMEAEAGGGVVDTGDVPVIFAAGEDSVTTSTCYQMMSSTRFQTRSDPVVEQVEEGHCN